jgi:Tol biopolymer transport system component
MLKRILATLTLTAGLAGLLGETSAQEQVNEPKPRGTIVFESDRDGYPGIYTINADGTDLTKLVDDTYSAVCPRWSPDGSKIAFISGADDITNVYVMNRDGSDVTQITTSGDASLYAPAWSPNGTQLGYISQDKIKLINIDGAEELLLVELEDASFAGLDWSAQGRIVSVVPPSKDHEDDWALFTVNSDGSNPSEELYDSVLLHPSWHPDGNSFLVSSRVSHSESEESNLEIVKLSEASNEILTVNPASDVAPRWSPSGDYFVFSSLRDSGEVKSVSDFNLDIYISNPRESNVYRLTTHEGTDTNPDWTEN